MKDKTKEVISKTGEVIEALPNTTFRVKLDDEEKTVLCTLSGKMRMYRIRVMPGDKVNIDMTPYDEKRGRITYRSK